MIRHSVCLVLLSFCALLTLNVHAAEGPLEEEQVTAAFIYNFVKFVTWPEGTFERNQGRLLVCTNEPDSLGGALATLSKRTVEGFTLDVQYLRDGEGFPVSNCNVLYVDDYTVPAEISSFSQAHALLVIGHSQPETPPLRSIVFRKADNKIRFDIYLGEAKRAGLEVSSFLLKLALNVYD